MDTLHILTLLQARRITDRRVQGARTTRKPDDPRYCAGTVQGTGRRLP